MFQELQIFAFICTYSDAGYVFLDFAVVNLGLPPQMKLLTGSLELFCFHIAHISFAISWYLFCLSAIVLARLCAFGTAMSIKKVFFVFLLMNVISGRIKSIVLSVSMVRFQYSLKLSFSSTLAGVYL
jgi:hypothetical protein